MATRLYPNTTNVAILEKLAGVPAGTSAALDIFEAVWDAKKAESPRGFYDSDLGYEEYKARQENAAIDQYHNFMLYGWGRVDPRVCRDDNNGTTDEADCKVIANAHGADYSIEKAGLTLADLEGFHWN